MDFFTFIIAYKDMKSIGKICDELNISYSNLVNGKTSEENEKKVVDKLKIEVFKIYASLNLLGENNGK